MCTEARNVRLSAEGSLEPVGAPEPMAVSDDYVPVCRCLGPDKRHKLLCVRGNGVALADVRAPQMAPAVAEDVLPANTLCALAQGREAALVMTKAGPVRLATTTLRATALLPDWPAVTLRAADAGDISATVAARTLSRSYEGASRLAKADSEALGADMADAYCEIAARAATAGAYIQPALARYKLTDSAGRVLFTSAPVLLSHATGAQCTDALALTSADRHTVGAYTLTADTWRPEMELPAAAGARCDEVAALELWLCPPFHSYLPGARTVATVNRASATGAPFVYVGLPGRECGLGEDSTGHTMRRVAAAVAHIDELEERVAVIANPFGAGPRTVKPECAPAADAGAASAALESALRRRVARHGMAEVLLHAPHTFAAAHVATDGATTAWADLRVQRFRGYGIGTFAAATEACAWEACTTVTMTDGSAVVRRESGSTGAPTALTPLLSYPAPDAVEIRVAVTTAAGTRMAAMALQPDATGRCSASAVSSARPVALTKAAMVSDALVEPVDVYPGMVALAPSEHPLDIAALCTADAEGVRALVGSSRSDRSWEFGRCRFTIGTPTAIHSLAYDARTGRVSLRCLHHHGVADAGSMVAAGAGEVFAIAGMKSFAGGELVHIDSGGVCRLFSPGRQYAALAWEEERGELLALRSGGTADVYCCRHGWQWYERDLAYKAVWTIGGEPFCASDGHLCSLAREAPAGDVEVGYAVVCEAARPAVAVHMSGRTEGDVTVEATSRSDGSYRPVLTVSLSGDIGAPLRLLTAGRPGLCRRIALRARVAASWRLRSIS